jgi:NAD(P)H-hydrate repair Nnr-like enzyme with NAD(P)H-hydrate epimerase domain
LGLLFFLISDFIKDNGGDALVAARHLAHFGYLPCVLYPKTTQNQLYLVIILSKNAIFEVFEKRIY